MIILMGFLAFNFIVLVHELGHFIVAKLSGIKVQEFSLFVGPKLFSIVRGDTTYSLRLFPILAYVRMEGEEEKSESEAAFNKKPLGVRAAVIAAGPLMNLVVAVVVLAIVFSVTGFNTTEISKVSENSAASKAGLVVGDKIISYNGRSVYQPADLLQFVYVDKGAPASIEVLRNDKRLKLNIVPEVIKESKAYRFGFSAMDAKGPKSNIVSSVSPGSPAEEAGLQPGDRIIKLNDTIISEKPDIDSFMLKNKDKPVKMVIERNGNYISKIIKPKVIKIPEQYYLGVAFELARGSVLGAIRHSFVFTWSTVRNVGYSIAWLIEGKVSLNQMVGPVGMVSTIGDVVEQGTTAFDKLLRLLNITAFISIALGATNLVPFPALDGNKLLLIIIEAICRKPIPPEKEAFISMIGFVILIALSIFTLYNDTIRIIFG